MTDQNQALPAQGSDVNQQGEQHNNNNQTMESLLNEQELNVDLPQAGEIRTGVIASISSSQILVSIGAKSEGVVSGRELDHCRLRNVRRCRLARKSTSMWSTLKMRMVTLSFR